MFYFVQFRRDKKEAWKMVEENLPLEHPPAFKTVLAISGDPGSFTAQGLEPETNIRYFGPMYFDLDGDGEIDNVLDAAREIVASLIDEYKVPANAIKAYLSGKKGVHLLVHQNVFGLKQAKPMVPLVWKKFALKFESKFVDRSVYSMGKGRIWRCCNIKRPDTGTHKVQITLEELEKMDSAQYAEIVKTPRDEWDYTGEIPVVPALASFFDAALKAVRKEVKDKKKALKNTSVADLRAVPGVPGCIEKLITIGDCADSNWNQASMQLAGYIAGRYDRDEEADEYKPLIEKFLENVTSSSRPAKADREKEMRAQLDRAFSGATRFSAGGVIATIGDPCGNCVICERERVLATQSKSTNEENEYDDATSIRMTPAGVFMVGKDSARQILNCGIRQSVSYTEYDNEKRQERVLSGTYELFGGDVENPYQVEVDETVFTDRRRLSQELAGSGAVFEGNEQDLQRFYRTLMKRRKGIDKMIRTPLSGIILHQTEDDIIPSLVTRDESFVKGFGASSYLYCGPLNLAPTFSKVRDFIGRPEDNQKLSVALHALFGMNEPQVMYSAIGWVCAAHLKPFLTHVDRSYPMLSLCGVSETGKSSTAFLLLALNAFPYRGAPSWNAETDTIYPLHEMVTTSTTIIRMIEEANESNAGKKWNGLVGVLKASWDQAGISKGALKGRTVVTENKQNPAPLMYLSEQPFPIQSVRTRSVECLLSPKSVEEPEYSANYTLAVKHVEYLEMLAKVFATTALHTTMRTVKSWRQRAEDLLPPGLTGRTRVAYGVVVVGLLFLSHVCETYGAELKAFVDDVIDDYIRMLERDEMRTMSDKRVSSVAEMLMAIDQMAMERENVQHGLKGGTHYWMDSDSVYLDARSVFPRFQRYMRGVGRDAQIHSYLQMMKLLRGEAYCKGTVSHPESPSTQLVQLDIEAMRTRGIEFPHFQEQVLA